MRVGDEMDVTMDETSYPILLLLCGFGMRGGSKDSGVGDRRPPHVTPVSTVGPRRFHYELKTGHSEMSRRRAPWPGLGFDGNECLYGRS